jgi:hypothetical protein
MKLNGTHRLLAYVDDANLLGDNIETTKKKTEEEWCLLGRVTAVKTSNLTKNGSFGHVNVKHII